MRKEYSFQRLFDGNVLVLACVLFTISMLVNTVASTIAGREHISTIWDFIFLSAPIIPIAIFKHLWQSGVISKNEYLFWGSIPVFYLMSFGLTMLYTFLQGLFSPMTPNYFMTFINYTIMFAAVLFGAIIIDLVQTAKANDNLKKIHASQKE